MMTGSEQSSNVSDFHILRPFDLTEYPLAYTEPLYGYASPIVITLTIFLNTVIISIMSQERMRSATALPLMSIALSDMLTGLTRLPFLMHQYTFQGHLEHPSLFWCHVFEPLMRTLPTIFHTASVWLNVSLAVHRYCRLLQNKYANIYIRSSFMVKTIICIFISATLFHLHRFFLAEIIPIKARALIQPTGNGSTIIVQTCAMRYREWVGNVYFNVYYVCRAIFVQFIPCILLTVFTYLLTRSFYERYSPIRKTSDTNNVNSRKRIRNAQRTTFMLVVVLICFLVTEVPFTLLLIIVTFQNVLNLTLISYNCQKIAGYILNFLILLNFPCNFFIYCLLSKRFRKGCLHLLRRNILSSAFKCCSNHNFRDRNKL